MVLSIIAATPSAMIRRNLLAIVCLTLGGAMVMVCAFVIFNFVQLAKAQTFAQAFVTEAVNEGSRMPIPDVAAGAGSSLSHDRLIRLLDRARRIGPLVSLQATTCAVQTDPQNLCAGQLLACVVDGQGQLGLFEARIAMCRSGDFASYRLAQSAWTLQFSNGEPVDGSDRSPI